MINDRKIGDPILFINGYGLPDDNHYSFKYGYVTAGFILNIEHIKEKNAYLYKIGTLSYFNRCKTDLKILGAHLIFPVDKLDEAELKLSQICEEPDYNEDEDC